VILAAGEASRFRAAAGASGPVTKLVAQHEGKALIRHVAEAALGAGLAPVIVVTGHAEAAVANALAGLDVTLVRNPDYASGMASSLKAGLAAAPAVDAAMVLLGDMPLVSTSLIARLVQAFRDQPRAAAVLPVHAGVRGNPVLLSAALFPDLAKLTGDAGARQILRGRDADVVEVVVDEPATRLDVDTPDALSALPKN
jgi:molybdenum cofactor cytidylyltransferase